MRSVVTRFVIALTAALALCGAEAPTGFAGESIQPGQHFLGLVNGSDATPVVYTVCPGPSTDRRTGPVAGGQTFGVARIRGGHGYTGPFSNVYVWFVPNATHNGHLEVRFTTYGAQKAIPDAARVPCDGAGRVEFSSCPYLAPCAAGWVPTYVRVDFVNIAARHLVPAS